MFQRRAALPEPKREAARYGVAVPIIIELSNGLFRPADRVEAYVVDLSKDGAALVARADDRFKLKKRYRVAFDDHGGIIEVRNLSNTEDGQVRLGARFSRLGLELQELVVDSLAEARAEASRLKPQAA